MTSAPAPQATIRWTARAGLLLAVGAALLLSSVLVRSPVPLFVALPLLLAPIVAAGSFPKALERVELAWEPHGLGAEVRIQGTLTGEFGADAESIEIRMPLPAGFVEARKLEVEREPQEVRFSTVWRLPEPTIVTVEPPVVVWSDPLGTTERLLGGSRPELPLQQYPIALKDIGDVQLNRTVMMPGETRTRRQGMGGEFFALRAAQANEPYRRINWKASARIGKLLANDLELERAGDLLVVLDTRRSRLGQEHDERLLGLGRAAAYGVAEAFLRSRARVGFASYGEFVAAVPLASGRIHSLRILQAIRASPLSDVAGPASRCAIALGRYYPLGVTTLIISSWTGEPTFDLLPYVRRQGFPVILLSPSPSGLRAGDGRLDAEGEQLAKRVDRLERRERLAPLWVYGPVVDWDEYWTLDALVRYLRHPVLRRAG